MEQKKQARAVAKAQLTKAVKLVQRLTAERALTDLRKALKGVKTAFEAFDVAHEDYAAVSKEEDADAVYYDAVFEGYVKAVREANASLESTAATSLMSPVRSKTNLDAAMALSAMNLPRAEMKIFSGDVTEYHLWTTTFDELGDSAAISDRAKLTRLLQYTSGRAYDAIKYCAMDKDGYQEARRTLAKQFGNDHLVTDALVSQLKDGGPVKSPEDIRKFGNELLSCQRMLKQSKMLAEIEGQAFIAQLSLRLPGFMRSRWVRKATEQRRNTGCYPVFAEFAAFVSEEADDANDPIYGKLQGANNQPAQRAQAQAKRAFASSADGKPINENKLSCYFCQEPHKIFNCKKLKEKSPEDKLDFVKKSRLCHVCFSPNHVSSNCRSTYVCSVNECRGRHSRLLHDALISTASTTSMSTSSRANHVDRKSSASTCIPTVDVVINSQRVSAVLDTASDATFCSRDLVERLGLRGEYLSISLHTLSGPQRSDAERVNLCVRSLDETKSLWLCNVIVVQEIPVTNPDVSVADYEHLNGLNFHSSDSRRVDS